MKNSDLLTSGCKIYHSLSGDHDTDYFLTQNDMSESHWSLLLACHHTGQCDDDTYQASQYFEIIDYKKAYKYLIECGLERETFRRKDDKRSKDYNKILQYYLWLLAGDIQERMNNEVWVINDWTNKLCFNGIEFKSFDDAESWLDIKLGDTYDTDRQEYYIQLKDV